MKLVRCPNPGCRGEPALGPPTPKFPGGEPVVIGVFTGGDGHPLVLKCGRCKTSFRLGAVEFNRLPEASRELLVELGLEWP